MKLKTGNNREKYKQKLVFGGALVAQSVKCLTLDFGSVGSLMVGEIKLCVGLCIDSAEPASDSLSLPLPHVLYLSKLKKK